DDPEREDMYLVCGAIAEKNNNPLAGEALQAATAIQPDNPRARRMLARSYRHTNNTQQAQAAAQDAAAVQAEHAASTNVAEQHFQSALPTSSRPDAQSFAASSLGSIRARIDASRANVQSTSTATTTTTAVRPEIRREIERPIRRP